MTEKGVLNTIGQFRCYLFWSQSGSKRRCAREDGERMVEGEKI